MLLFSAEAFCYPPEMHACQQTGAWYQKNRPTKYSYKYLNSGGWMGPADLALQIIDANYNFTATKFEKEDDQGMWQDVLVNDPKSASIMIDHQGQVFRTLYQSEGDLECRPTTGWFSRQAS